MTNPIKILLGNLKTILSFGSSNANKNVVTDENGDLKVENKNNHSHGNISSAGTLSETSKNVVTDGNGNITTEAKLIGSSTATDIKMNGTQSAGSSSNYAKADHIHPSDTSKVDKVSGKGLSTNDFTNSYKNSLDSINSSYPSAINQIANLTANKLDNKQTNYKGKNVVVNSTTGEITFEDKNNHTHNEYLTSSSLTGYLTKTNADTYYQPIGSYLTSNDITGKLDKSQTSYKGKNVVVHSTSGEITFEDKNNHNHNVNDINGLSSIATSGSYNDLNNIPSIVEEMPFYWVDDFLTYASNSYNVFYDPNNDVQYLVEFIGSSDNDSGFTSNDIKTDRLYQIPYGSSYTHDIYIAFSYDETNEEYNAYYVTTTERYATQYELSLKATSSDISSAISIHDGSNSAHSDIRLAIPKPSSITPGADTTYGSIGSNSYDSYYAKADHTHPKSNLYAEASHSHDINNITGLQTALDNKLNTANLSAQLETIVQNLINEANQS